MPCRATRTDQVGSHDRLTVAWLKGVQGAQSESDEGSRDEEPEARLRVVISSVNALRGVAC